MPSTGFLSASSSDPRTKSVICCGISGADRGCILRGRGGRAWGGGGTLSQNGRGAGRGPPPAWGPPGGGAGRCVRSERRGGGWGPLRKNPTWGGFFGWAGFEKPPLNGG